MLSKLWKSTFLDGRPFVFIITFMYIKTAPSGSKKPLAFAKPFFLALLQRIASASIPFPTCATRKNDTVSDVVC